MKMAKSVQYLTADVAQWLLLAFSNLTKLTSLLPLLDKVSSILVFGHIAKSHLGFGPIIWPRMSFDQLSLPILNPLSQITWGPRGNVSWQG